MSKFCLVLNGVIDRVQEFDVQPPAIPHKGVEWLPYVKNADPAFDPDTHKLGPWSKAVSNGTVVESCQAVELSPKELADRKADWLANDDRKNMGRVIEDVMVAIATGQHLTRNTFAPEVWAKINKRLAKRGKGPV